MNVRRAATPDLHRFDPSDSRALRHAFARFATGVTVITTRAQSGPAAITANSFTSVSLEPPLVLWCLGRESNRFEAFISAQHYAIHVLAADQQAYCDLFARDGTALAGMQLDENAQAVPILPGCLARFDCALRDVHEAGDHYLIIGEVLGGAARSGAALGFFQGALAPYPG